MAVTKKPESVAVSPTSTYRVPVAAPAPAAPAPVFGVPSSYRGTSSAQYGQVSPTGVVEVPPLGQIPVSAYGTSSAQYGQVSPTGQVEVPAPGAYNQPIAPSAPTQQAPSTSLPVSTPAKAQEKNYRTVSKVEKDGSISTYKLDPSISYIRQMGEYEYDFWTLEGQKERLLNALDTATIRTSKTAIMGKNIPVASEALTVMIDLANVGAILNAATNVLKMIGTMGKAGSLALTPGGAETLASTLPEAAGVATKTAAAAGTAATNTKNAATGIKALTSLISGKGLVRTSVIGYFIVNGFTSKASMVQERTDFAKDSGELALKLREVGMTDMADELNEMNKDLKDGMDVVIPYIPFLGKMIEGNKINADREVLDQMTLKYEAAIKADQEQAILEQKAKEEAAAEIKRQQDLADLADKRAYEEKQLEERRTYEETQTAEKRTYEETQQAQERAYEEQQAAQQYQQQLGLEAGALEQSQPSTLNFGLLHTSGAVEFVDRDKAAEYYFGKVYEELTPEQQMLLNLLKGGQK